MAGTLTGSRRCNAQHVRIQKTDWTCIRAGIRRAEAKRKEIEARQFKERLAERQETLDERRQKKAEEEAVSVLCCTVRSPWVS